MDNKDSVDHEERVMAGFAMWYLGQDKGDTAEVWETAGLRFSTYDLDAAANYADLMERNEGAMQKAIVEAVERMT